MVRLANDSQGQYYAIKVMDKSGVAFSREKSRERVWTEISLMQRLRHPFIAYLFWAYQARAGGLLPPH